MSDTEKKPSRFMNVFPVLTFTPRSETSETIHVDAEISKRCLIVSNDINCVGENPKEAIEDMLNTLALGISNVAMWADVSMISIVAALSARLSTIEKANVVVDDQRKPLSVVKDD